MKQITFFIALMLGQSMSSAQTISLFAGSADGSATGFLDDGHPATASYLDNPAGGFFDQYGNCYFAECQGNRVCKVDPSGILTTVAGTRVSGFSGDGGPATAAKLWVLGGIALDAVGNLYICDGGNGRIRKVDATTGIISTFAGNGNPSSTGDGGPATAASLNNPLDLAFDRVGNLYVAEYFGQRIRKIAPSGIITTFAGNGINGYSGDGSRADTAALGPTFSVCFDKDWNLYTAAGYRVFKINTAGYVSTFAGVGPMSWAYNGDERPATTANIYPIRIRFDHFGNLFIAENINLRVRYVDKFGYIHTAAGDGTRGVGAYGVPASAAQFNYPNGVFFDSCNNLYITDAGNRRICKVTYPYCNYLSVSEVAAGEELTVYPNPANDVVHVNGVGSKTHYYLADAAGRVLQAGPLQQGNNEVPLNDLSSGMYLLILTNKDGSEVRKVVKQ